ncbi:MAG: hypothetical protein IIY34_07000, partial [Clostridia bacterium]|nr:hypothetical protein [Clostridia bacterium]
LSAPLSARRDLLLKFNPQSIVVMRALLQVFEAFRHEASFKTVLPPIGAAAPVTSVPAWGYATLNGKALNKNQKVGAKPANKYEYDL